MPLLARASGTELTDTLFRTLTHGIFGTSWNVQYWKLLGESCGKLEREQTNAMAVNCFD